VTKGVLSLILAIMHVMPRINKVLLSTDLSWQSRKLAECTQDLSLLGATDVYVFYSLRPGIALKGGEVEILEEMVSKLQEAGFRAQYEVLAGFRPFRDIIDHASRVSCDAILIASSGKGRATEFLVGSTSKAVMRHSSLPVLVKRYNRVGDIVQEACVITFSNVIMVVDSEENGSTYLQKAEEILDRKKMARVNFYDVATGRTWEWKEGYNLREGLGRGLGDLRKGEVHPSLMKAINSLQATAVVLPRKGKGSMSWLLDRQRTERSIHSSKASMLIIPE